MKRLIIGLALLLACISCQRSNYDDDIVVATVYDKVLYQSDLQVVLYEGISRSDSIVRTKVFIDNWIRQQLLLQQANTSLTKSELNFSKQIENYRNSLIVYKYESQYVDKNLDTVVSDKEIANYIEKNSPEYELDDEAIRHIIINERKKALLDRLNNNLYNKAVKDNVFVIY
jgi:hypothetical protein